MVDAFVVTLRELAELCLILVAVDAAVAGSGRRHARRWMALGTALGAGSGSLFAWLAFSCNADERLGAWTNIAIGVTVIALVSTSLVGELPIRRRTLALFDRWMQSSATPWLLAGFVAFVTAREVLELLAMLRSIGPESSIETGSILGSLLGIAGIVGLLSWRHLRARLLRLAVFRLSALATTAVALQMLLEGVSVLAKAPGASGDPVVPTAWTTWAIGASMAVVCAAIVRSWWKESAIEG